MSDGLAKPLRANAHASVLIHYWQALLPQDSQDVIQWIEDTKNYQMIAQI